MRKGRGGGEGLVAIDNGSHSDSISTSVASEGGDVVGEAGSFVGKDTNVTGDETDSNLTRGAGGESKLEAVVTLHVGSQGELNGVAG